MGLGGACLFVCLPPGHLNVLFSKLNTTHNGEIVFFTISHILQAIKINLSVDKKMEE